MVALAGSPGVVDDLIGGGGTPVEAGDNQEFDPNLTEGEIQSEVAQSLAVAAVDDVVEAAVSEVVAEESAGESPDDVTASSTIADLQSQIAKLTEELSTRDKLKMQLVEETLLVDRAASEVLSCESAVEEAKGELKAAKERYDKRVNQLRDMVRDVAMGQGRLDFEGTAKEVVAQIDAVQGAIEANAGAGSPSGSAAMPAVIDPAISSPITELGKKKLKQLVGAEEFDRAKNSEEPIGLTDGQLETIEGEGCQTIADLEKKLREYPLFLQDLKGFGAAAQNRLTASLLAWRKVNPQPEVPAVAG
jgi:hypothetical protein